MTRLAKETAPAQDEHQDTACEGRARKGREGQHAARSKKKDGYTAKWRADPLFFHRAVRVTIHAFPVE